MCRPALERRRQTWPAPPASGSDRAVWASLPDTIPERARLVRSTPMIREGRDEDADGLIALLGGVFAEYPGCVLDVDGELPELRAIATSFRRWGGRFWVDEREGVVIACI